MANARPLLTRDCQVVYVNGVNTGRAEHDMAKRLLEFIFNQDDFQGRVRVDGVHLEKNAAAESVVRNALNLEPEELEPLIGGIEELTSKALEEDRLPTLVGHSWGNVVIKEFLQQHPDVADRVRIISLGSPTRALPSKHVTHIVEEEDPVGWLGAFTRFAIASAPGGPLFTAALGKTGAMGITPDFEKLFHSLVATINEQERDGFSPYKIVFSTNPLLGRDRVNESFDGVPDFLEYGSKVHPFTAPVGRLVPVLRKIFTYKALLEKHGVILSYLSGPGLVQFRLLRSSNRRILRGCGECISTRNPGMTLPSGTTRLQGVSPWKLVTTIPRPPSGLTESAMKGFSGNSTTARAAQPSG